jgi:hypothetical protein
MHVHSSLRAGEGPGLCPLGGSSGPDGGGSGSGAGSSGSGG